VDGLKVIDERVMQEAINESPMQQLSAVGN